MTKTELRKHILEIREAIPQDLYVLRSALICDAIESFLEDYTFTTLHGYIPFRNEVDILPLLKKYARNGIQIITSIPKNDGRLDHIEFDPLGTYSAGKFGVPIPMLYKPFDGDIDIILVPGVVFDHHGNRIGYGGGYYDRFLEIQDRSTKIGVCFEEQLEIDIPTESFDQKVDIVLNA